MAIRFISPKDYESLRNFFIESRNIHYSETDFEHRYSINDSQLSMVYEVGVDKQIAAFLGVFIEKIIIDGKETKIAQFVDGVSNAKFRGKGYFKELALRVKEECGNLGCQFIFGFPNDMAFPVWTKMGWVFNGEMIIYKLWVPTLPLSLITNYNRHFAKRCFEFLKKPNHLTTEACQVLNDAEECYPVRSMEFLKRKRLGNKTMVTIEGVVMILKFEKSLQVGIVSKINDADHIKRILRKLRYLCFCTGIIRIDFTFHSKSKVHKIFQSSYSPNNNSGGVPVGFWKINQSINTKDILFDCIDFDTY